MQRFALRAGLAPLVLASVVLGAGCARFGSTGLAVPAYAAPRLFDNLIAVAPRFKVTFVGRQPDHITLRTQYGDWLTYRAQRDQVTLEVIAAKAERASKAQIRARVAEVLEFGRALVEQARASAFDNAVFR